MEILIENVRSFSGNYCIPVKPITLLTGENSSGKSTFLAALAVTVDPFSFPLRPRFNEPPYSLGNYDTIATYKGGRYGRAASFSLGLRKRDITNPKSRKPIEILATYTANQGRAEVSAVTCKSASMEATVTLQEGDKGLVAEWSIVDEGVESAYRIQVGVAQGKALRLNMDDLIFFSLMNENKSGDAGSKQRDAFTKMHRLFSLASANRSSRAVSIAPIRTKPRRTYDQINEDFTPEGEHIPFVLSSLLNDTASRETFERFGAESGLYKKLAIKKLGDKVSGPVQVMVTNEGRTTNLLDVGYGVSQALPVIVESLLAPPESLMLVQQPEVHLHPRAQAALGSLFTNLHKTQKKSFVIETHSDYIIDRIRQEVAKGEIKPSDVGVLYFEKHGSETRVHPLTLDKAGNILDAPPSYREFFLHEELNLLNRTGS